MPAANFDPSILQDFLTESGELLEQLEGDLVQLERSPGDPEMLNKVFRALHTIKGSASFLSLTNLVEIAHAAESALNAARNRVVEVNAAVMTLLLQAVDTVKIQMGQLAAGEDLVAPDAGLVGALTDVGLGKQPGEAASESSSGPSPSPSPSTPAAPVAGAPASAAPAGPSADGSVDLPPGKADLLEFLVTDLNDSLQKIKAQVAQLRDASTRAAGAAALIETSDGLVRSVEFFEFEPMSRLAHLLALIGDRLARPGNVAVDQILPRAEAILALLEDQARALAGKKLVGWPTEVLAERVKKLCEGEDIGAEAMLAAGIAPADVLRVDQVRGGQPAAPTNSGAASSARTKPVAPAPSATPSPEQAAPSKTSAEAAPTEAEKPRTPAAKSEPAKPEAGKVEHAKGDAGKAEKPEGGKAAGVDQTIRVEVGRLESLMNLVGELVLQKNRIAALSRQSRSASGNDGETFAEAFTMAAGSLDRVTADIQLAVMRTRMQPLDKIFGKYPRLIRDLSMKTGKKLELVIEGGETEVDKSVIDELSDPLIHLLRNSADHGIEMPEQRAAAGKSETGTITLRAAHEGSHVVIRVLDNGRGLSRDRIGKKAIERGLTTPTELAALSDRQVYQFIFEAGFSTAEKVTDLSGRGVGMDVVRSNITKLKGTIELDSVEGQGATVSIKIPLTVAIMPAMLVGVGSGEKEEIYAIPLGNILEIVKPEDDRTGTVGQAPVMRLRDSVLPLVRGPEVFGVRSENACPTPFAVVLSVNAKRFGLLVSRLIGQQEIVIKRLDELCDKERRGGPISGATVRDDGGVSLIVDVGKLLLLAEQKSAA